MFQTEAGCEPGAQRMATRRRRPTQPSAREADDTADVVIDLVDRVGELGEGDQRCSVHDRLVAVEAFSVTTLLLPPGCMLTPSRLSPASMVRFW